MDNMNNGMNMGNNMNMGGGYTMNGGNAPEYTLWLILGIVQMLGLCCCNCIAFGFGLGTVITISNANNAFKNGDMMTYQSKVKTAKIINLIGWAIMFGGVIISFVTGAFGMVSEMFSSMSY